jgi:hypothetical protein
MTDDYSYRSQEVTNQSSNPFALGSKSDSNSIGLTGIGASNGYSSGSGANTGSFTSGGGGTSSFSGGLPAGNQGNLLYHNGTTWIVLAPESGTLIMQDNTPTWLVGDFGVVVHGDFSEPTLLTAPEGGTYVLGSVDGEIKWVETVDCEEEE